MWVKDFTLTLRVPQGDPTLNICKSSDHPYKGVLLDFTFKTAALTKKKYFFTSGFKVWRLSFIQAIFLFTICRIYLLQTKNG